jgi:hypothetical protein
MQSMQEDLKNAITAKGDLQDRFDELFKKHEEMLARLEQIVASMRPFPLKP